MLNLLLIVSYLGSLSSNQMLSMLLLLVVSYIAAALWFIQHGIIYTGLLYVLVYVGAIVVLIMFVVQLTNTSLSGDNSRNSNYFNLLQNTGLILSVSALLTYGYLNGHSDNFILNFTNLNLTDYLPNPNKDNSINLLTNNVNPQKGLINNNLSVLANSIFNEYALILIISVHAIILAVLGPIKLALNATN